MSEQNNHRSDLTRGDALLDELRQRRPGQFRVASMFVGIFVVSLALAFPRIVGLDYAGYFLFLWFALFTMAPLFALTVTGCWPWRDRGKRVVVFATCILLATAPPMIWLLWLGEYEELVGILAMVAMVSWIPQSVCMAVVWFFLFRR